MELCDGGCVATLLRHYGALRWNIVARSLSLCLTYSPSLSLSLSPSLVVSLFSSPAHPFYFSLSPSLPLFLPLFSSPSLSLFLSPTLSIYLFPPLFLSLPLFSSLPLSLALALSLCLSRSPSPSPSLSLSSPLGFLPSPLLLHPVHAKSQKNADVHIPTNEHLHTPDCTRPSSII
jgi:hypothetical protein